MKIEETQLADLVSSGQTEKAFDLLITQFKSTDHPRLNDVRVMKANYDQSKRRHQTGMISDQAWQEIQNNIHFNLLELAGGNISSVSHQKATIPGWYGYVGLALVICIAAGWLYRISDNNAKPVFPDHLSLVSAEEKFENLATDKLGLELYPAYQQIYRNNITGKKTETITGTDEFIRQALEFRTDDFGLNNQIYHRISLMVAYKMLALMTNDSARQREYAAKGLAMSAEANQLIQRVNSLPNGAEKEEIRSWISENNHENRIVVNTFILKLIEFRSGGPSRPPQILEAYRALPNPDAFLEEEGYLDYPIIKWFYTEIKTK